MSSSECNWRSRDRMLVDMTQNATFIHGASNDVTELDGELQPTSPVNIYKAPMTGPNGSWSLNDGVSLYLAEGVGHCNRIRDSLQLLCLFTVMSRVLITIDRITCVSYGSQAWLDAIMFLVRKIRDIHYWHHFPKNADSYVPIPKQ